MSMSKLAAWSAAVSLLLAVAPALAQAPVVDAPAGAARGVAEGELDVFRGLPYAAPPVGAVTQAPSAPPAYSRPRPGSTASTPPRPCP
jgi:para-nitrobenzyl esterase